MNKYKICVYAICKNEEKFVERWVNSMRDADYIVVCDTGSTDNTIDKFKALGINPKCINISPWRFDEARNQCIDLIPEDVDICICTDLDEVLEPGWREVLESNWKPNTKQARYTFIWASDSNDNPLKTSIAVKIHALKGFKWIYPVHEVLDYSGSDPFVMTDIYDLKVRHLQDRTKSRAQYLPLLELSAKLYPGYDRNIHYLGREYMYHKKYNECIETLKHHLSLPTALWSDERAASMRYIASSYQSLGDMLAAKSWLLRAIAESPHTREPYLAMAKLAYELHDWALLYWVCESALRIPHPTGSYLDEPECWGYLFDDFAGLSCYHLGLGDKAIKFAQKALAYDPDDIRLQNNLMFCLNRFKK
ncbi:glycosyltransferase [Paraclostridium bifermentans]|uniref:Glycosyltransferase n=1 Tax=Paraclostridium bifermentans TaxID=1490 RepID=A0A5P3X914_PARBF|nr:glycosyltransferase [Paraclostridium bifermentans]QEZ67477.1 glycosyltransferase [Paraclostridium bifermentans]